MISLEDIKTTQDKLAAMIAAYEKQPAFPITIQQPRLNDGERYVGTIVSADGRRYSLILLPGDSKDAAWEKQMEWAASIGGELPDRVEGALLFATMKDEFKPEAYWTRERPADAGWAWYQTFFNGLQHYDNVDGKLRARALRREPIE